MSTVLRLAYVTRNHLRVELIDSGTEGEVVGAVEVSAGEHVAVEVTRVDESATGSVKVEVH